MAGTIAVSGYFATKEIQSGAALKKVFMDYATSGAVISILILLFLFARLETMIKEDGVYVRFFPFHIRFKHFHWEDLSLIYVRKYAPIAEFG